jgi:hypothetical protein
MIFSHVRMPVPVGRPWLEPTRPLRPFFQQRLERDETLFKRLVHLSLEQGLGQFD